MRRLNSTVDESDPKIGGRRRGQAGPRLSADSASARGKDGEIAKTRQTGLVGENTTNQSQCTGELARGETAGWLGSVRLDGGVYSR
jgi:hypothetical protein